MKGVFLRLVVPALILCFSPFYSEASDINLERNLQNILQQDEGTVKTAKDKFKKGDSIAVEISRLKSNAGKIRALYLQLQERFRLRKEGLKTAGPKAQERHSAMAEGYKKAIEEYLSLIDSLAPEGQSSVADVDKIKALLDKILHKKKKPILGSLPYRNLNYPSKEPSTDPAIKPAYKGGNRTVSPGDTNSTESIPISKEIAEFANSLNWKPVPIYEYLMSNIETEWSWGCRKSVEETLRQKSGNSCEQAALFAALLRASGFPTRVVRGTMEFFAGGRNGVAMERVKNLTGIDDPWKIAEFFQKAGIPYRPIITAGNISNFEIEHVWIESFIPYGNYRGTLIDNSDPIWLGLDTTIKVDDYLYNNPIDILSEVPLAGLRDIYLNAINTITPLEYVKASLEGYLAQKHPGLAYNDLLRTHTSIPLNMKILPNSTQFVQTKITHEYIEIPDELKHKVKFTAADRNNNELFAITIDTMKLSNEKIAVSYEPETVEDQEIIDSYGGLDNTPAYLVQLRPALKINGEMVVAGKDGLPMGSDYNLTIELISPTGTESITSTHIVGNLSAIGIVSQKALSSQDTIISEEDDAETILFKEANRYIDRWNQAEEELASLLHLTMTRQMPTVVTVGGVIDVTYLLDMPHGYEWKGVFIDAQLRAINTVVSHGNAPAKEDRNKTFMTLSGLQGSILENRLFEDDFKVDSISTAKLLEISNTNRTPIVSIDKMNIDSILYTLPFDDNIKEDITNSVNQNLAIRIPLPGGQAQSEIVYDDWTGVGYLKENLDTKESGWLLSGMIAGGMTAVSPDKWLSQNLAHLLGKPYTASPRNELITQPLILITSPFDGATLSVSPIDVEGIVSDPSATVDINGIRASVSTDGRFIAKGITLSEGTNVILANIRDIIGKTNSHTISVNYVTRPVTQISVVITSPVANAVITKPFVMVIGTHTSQADEISIKVNGVVADVSGNKFVANNVPLVDGDNRIIVNALDSSGAIGRAELTVKADTSKPYITLTANITSGIPRLSTYFQISTATPNPIVSYQMDFDGDGVIDYTGDIFDNITYTYTTEGIYYPTVTVTDDQGNTYSDTIAVTVTNRVQIDTLLKSKWNKVKSLLAMKDIEGALRNFFEASRDMFSYNFNLLRDFLPQISQNMGDIAMVSVEGSLAKYEVLTVEDGEERAYYVEFSRDINGIWELSFF